ncbi:MAG: hypothetical protein ABS904_00010 [Solibacillus isronensis]
MNYIIYGSNTVEKSIFEEVIKPFSMETTLTIDDDLQIDDVRSSVRYAPFFEDGWLVIVNLAKISKENVPKILALVNNPLVTLYCRIPHSKRFNKPNQDLFNSLKKSKVVNALPNLQIVNALYPSKDYIKKLIFSGLKRVYLSDASLHYLIENIRFDLDNLDNVIEEINQSGQSNIDISDMRIILPRTQTRSLKHYVYAILLSNRGDLKEHWNDPSKRIISQNGGTVRKPFEILNVVVLEPKSTLNIVISILNDMIKLKKYYQRGLYTLDGIFQEKEKLEKSYPFFKSLTIPAIIDYSKVFSEVSRHDLLYVLTSFMELKAQPEVTEDDLYLLTKKLMKRFERSA